MISEQEATKILNAGEVKYTAEEVRHIRDLMVALATIEYENYVENKFKKSNTNECNLLHKSEFKKAS